MGWIKPHDIHRCEKPKFDEADPHTVGDYWQCENFRCNQLWYVVTMATSSYEIDGVTHREIGYVWGKVSHKEYRWP